MAEDSSIPPVDSFVSSSILPPLDHIHSSSTSFNLSEPFGWILTVQCLVALILNLTALTTFCKDRLLRNDGSTALILNLVLADLGITICGCPFSAFAAFRGEWPFSELCCTLYGFQGMLFGLVSIMSVAAIQLDRYMMVSCNASSSTLFSVCGGHRVLSTGVIWLNAGFWASAPVFGWHRYGIEASGISCAIDYGHASASYVTWLAGVFLVNYVCPLIAMLYFEYSIRQQNSLISPASNVVEEDDGNGSKGFGSSKTFLGLLMVFFVCWTPYALLCVGAVFADVSLLPLPVVKLPAISAKMAAILNPLVYLSADGVKAAVRRLVCGESDKKEN